MDASSEFPRPTRVGNRLMFDRHDVENHKRRLMGLMPVNRDPSAPIVFVTAQQLAGELQVNRRSLGRRVKGRVFELTQPAYGSRPAPAE